MKKIIPILTLLILLALTGCSYKIIKTDDEKNEDINIESLENINSNTEEVENTENINSDTTESTEKNNKLAPKVIEKIIIKEVPAPTPEPAVDNSAEAKVILSFIEEIVKAQQFYDNAKGYFRQSTEYVLIKNLSAARSANTVSVPLTQQAYNTAMNIPVPILSGNCCSMSLVAIKKFYTDKYSCWSQWINTMEQTIVEMEELDAALDVGDLDKADEQLEKSQASLNIANNKYAECDTIDNQYSDVYKAMGELGDYAGGLAN